MGRNNYFQFKQFKVVQEFAAMKVGIDGVLLGAWADLSVERNVLDIGTGTGLLALMAAQRTPAQVIAVEIEAEAAAEAMSNFTNSTWSHRLEVKQISIQEFESNVAFDHILANPPFFDTDVKPPTEQRAIARHHDSLPLDELIKKSATLMTPTAKFSLVLPADKEDRLRSLAQQSGLSLRRLARVFPNSEKPSHRILAELGFNVEEENQEHIIIRNSETQDYSDQYRSITRDFYLKF